KQKIDHPDNRPIPPQDKNPTAIGLLEDEAKTLELLLFVGTEILFLAKKLAEKIRQLVQIFENRRLDNDFAHGCPRYSTNALRWQCGCALSLAPDHDLARHLLCAWRLIRGS